MDDLLGTEWSTDRNIGDVLVLRAETGHEGTRAVVVDVMGDVVDGQMHWKFEVRLPEGDVIEVVDGEFAATGESALEFRYLEVVRVLRSDTFPDLAGEEGVVAGFSEAAPWVYSYGVFVYSTERVSGFAGDELESLGRFDNIYE